MSFASPLWLLTLALVPAGVAAYLWARRRTRRYAIRFPAVATVREVVATTPSWERHVPAALALAAVALLGVALARPRVTDHIPTGQANMMLVTDHSGSMAAQDVQPTRLAAAVSAANTFIDQLPSSVRVGAIGFGTSPDAVQGPAADHAQARSLVDSLVPNGGTDTGDALGARAAAPAGLEPQAPAVGDRPALRRRGQRRARPGGGQPAGQEGPDPHLHRGARDRQRGAAQPRPLRPAPAGAARSSADAGDRPRLGRAAPSTPTAPTSSARSTRSSAAS